MKATILRLTIMTALALAFAASAQAQTALNYKTFAVPFSFKVGNKVLPAGEYKITADNQIIRVQKTDGKENTVTLTQRTRGTNNENNAKLTFRRYGDQYYLSQVWLPDSLGRELKRPRREVTDVAQTFSIVEIVAY
ncbi:MAG TPA: hypothetical protein VFT48_22130 [Pyrinomonadaceae bacterium]|nr:hypothetical protein [Pyrinomonadaceae bacterium]